MRRIRSESCTFIWHPKVLMQAVFPAPGSSGVRRRWASPRGSPGILRESGIGAVGVSLVVLLILFLRFLDAGYDGDLPWTTPELEALYLEVPGTGRPP